MIAVIVEYIILGYEFHVVASTLAYGIGSFWFGISTIEEIKRILYSINDEAQANVHESNELKLLLSEFIDLHEILKQLS